MCCGCRPFYTRGGGEADARDLAIAQQLRKALEPLLLKTVDVVIAGHEHTYTRTCAVANGQCCSGLGGCVGVVHLTVGTGGAGCGPPCPPRGPYPPGDGYWSEAHFEGFGYLRFAASRSSLRVQFVDSTTGSVFDEVELAPKP